jgi:uncharacterized protein
VVHALNNLFKFWLLGRHANKEVVVKFGLPAILSAVVGAWVLLWLSGIQPLLAYQVWGREAQVTPVKLSVALLMAVFALVEMKGLSVSLPPRYLPLGGILSGFCGGFSGHQGALRSPFLLKAGLTKESYIATGVVISLMVDIPRIIIYGLSLPGLHREGNHGILTAAVLAAFGGAWLGNRLLDKVTLRMVQLLVAGMLLAIAGALGSGLI